MKKYFKFIAIVICMIMAASLLLACGQKNLVYSGSTLANGKVGLAYSQSVATATGSDSISYALKTGSSLPAGLALSADGTVSGTPSAKTNGEVTFTVVAGAEGYNSAEAEFKLTVGEGTIVYSGGNLSARVGAQFNESVKTVTGAGSVTYTKKSGTLPEGITFDNGVFGGMPTTVTTAAAAITITASAAGYAGAEAVFNITVAAGTLSYTGKSLKPAIIGEVYEGDTTATATAATNETITYGLAGISSLPLGLSFANGAVSGTPTEAGSKSFSVTASAANYEDKTAAFNIVVIGDSVVYDGGYALPDGGVGLEYSESIATAIGRGTITYDLKAGSTLPAGLSLSKAGLISGTPEAVVNDHKFTVIASDSVSGMDPADAEFSISVVIPPQLSYSSSAIANLLVGQDCFKALPAATGAASITYALKTGSSLPEGLEISSKGILYGMPLIAANNAAFTVVASAKSYRSAEAEFRLTVTEGVYAIDGSATLPIGRVKDSYYELLKMDAPIAVQYTYSLKEGSALPAGLELRSDGLIHGKTTTLAKNGVSFTVVASAQGCKTVETNYSIRVIEEVTDTDVIRNFNGKTAPNAFIGEPYYASGAVKASNTRSGVDTTLSFELKAGSALPAGFELLPNGDLRSLNSVSAAAGSHTFTVVASSMGCPSVEANMTLEIKDPKVIARDIDIAAPVVGEAYSVSVDLAVAHGEAVTYTLMNTLPTGFVLSSAGVLSGTAVKSVKQFSVQVRVSAPNHSDVDMVLKSNIWDAVTNVPNGKFEAEYMNLRGKEGKGISNTPPDEELIQEDLTDGTASNGYFVGYTQKPIFFTFEFNCSKAVSGATLVFALGSEQGNVTLKASNTIIRVNGTAINFASVTVEGGDSYFTVFKGYTFANKTLSLVSGANTIEIEYLGSEENPGIDYMQISDYGDAVLSWMPHLYNLVRFN